jgi:hypothetical protein
MHGLVYVGTVICLGACLVVGQATSAGPSLSQEPGAQKLHPTEAQLVTSKKTLSKPQAKPTDEPTVKPTVKPMAKPTAKPTAKPKAKPKANSRTKVRHSAGSRGYWLDVTVKNPRCPACLKTLKTYLLALNGVREVNINYLAGREETVDILVRLANSLQRARVIERIKAHDLEILNTKS